MENAPGPKRAMPVAVMTMSKAMSVVPKDARGGAGINEKIIPTTHNPTSKLANGVMNPMIMPAPLTRNVSPTAHTSRVRSIRPDRSAAPSAMAMPPSAARIRSSPMPGWPPGKVENSLCSGILPVAHTKKRDDANYLMRCIVHNPRSRSLWVPLSRYYSVLTVHSWITPRRRPIATACVRSLAPNFSIMCLI